MYGEIRLQPCPSPPNKQTLMDILVKLCETQGKKLGIDEKRQPNTDWMVNLISTLDPFNEIFEKSYEGKKRANKEGHMLDNHDDFFTNLPLSKVKKTRYTRLLSKKITKEDRKQKRHALIKKIRNLKN
jgi:hypothetical protein